MVWVLSTSTVVVGILLATAGVRHAITAESFAGKVAGGCELLASLPLLAFSWSTQPVLLGGACAVCVSMPVYLIWQRSRDGASAVCNCTQADTPIRWATILRAIVMACVGLSALVVGASYRPQISSEDSLLLIMTAIPLAVVLWFGPAAIDGRVATEAMEERVETILRRILPDTTEARI